MSVALGSAYGEIVIDTGGAQRSISGLAGQLRSTGKTLALAIGIPAIAIGAAALKSAGDFEQSMNVMAQVSGATAEEMALFEEQALALGESTVFGAGDAADAMLELSKAGMTVAEVSGSIEGVLALAAAGGVGLAEAATLTAATLNTFGLEASESARIADMLAAGANASAADITDLGAGLQQAGFAFDMANQNADDLVASLAILTNVGLTGSDAGTALKNAMVRLMAPTAEAAGLMDEVGFSAYDATGTMRPLVDIIDGLNESLAGMTSEERDGFLATVFLSDGMKAMIPLLDLGADGFTEMQDAVNEEGAASQVAAARMKGLNGAMETLKSTFETLLLKMSGPFLDSLAEMVRGVAGALETFSNMPKPAIDTAVAFGLVAAGAAVLIGLFAAAPFVIGAVTAAFAFLVSPIGLVIAAVGLLGAAWATNFGNIRQIAASAWTFVQQRMQDLSGIFSKFAGSETVRVFTERVSGIMAQAQQTFGDLFSGKVTLGDFAGKMGEALGKIPQAISDLFGGADLGTLMADLQWADFIPKWTWDGETIGTLAWGDYVLKLDWKEFVATLTGWGDWITKLDWGAVGLTLIEWGDWIAKLDWGAVGLTMIAWGDWISKLDWGAVGLTLIDWGEWISKLDWETLGLLALDWGEWISKLDWGTIGLTLLDWAMWIPVISWSTFIGFVALISQVPKLDWGGFVSSLNWNNISSITSFAWNSFIAKLDWLGIITPLEAWNMFVDAIKWPDFVAMLSSWGDFIPDVDWADFVKALAGWGEFIAELHWSVFVTALTGWTQFIPTIDWGSFIPDFSWPEIPPFPGWAALMGFFGFGGAEAGGTSWAPGGLTLVGERGPELVVMPPGAEVLTNGQSNRFSGGGGGQTFNVTINGVRIDNERDMQRQAYRVAGMIAAGLA